MLRHLTYPRLGLVPVILATLLGAKAQAQFSGFADDGLVGVGSISANLLDTTGLDTIGGIFSSMSFDQSSLQITTDGSGNKVFSGTLFGQSDRGYNVTDSGLTTDFHPRLETFNMSITPNIGSPGGPGQIQLTNTATTIYSDVNGNPLTGQDPNSISTVASNGIAGLPQASANNHISLDPEGVVKAPDGTIYTSDEYGPIIYHFSSTGHLLNVIIPPAAFTPISGGSVNYTGQTDPTDSGRTANRGLEGLTLTPDGQYLVGMMQGPLVQDGGSVTNSSGKIIGQNTRIVEYYATGPKAGQLAHEYTYTLHTDANDHGRVTGTSEILAISDTQFLVLDRDSSGRGAGNNNVPSYKEVVAVDVTGATDLAGTGFDKKAGTSGALSLPTAGLSASGTNISGFGLVKPVTQQDLVNLIDPSQLAKFGQNVSPDLNSGKSSILSDTNSVPEKLEGMALIPMHDPTKPNDFLLLVGSDNDYITQSGVIQNGVLVPGSKDTTAGTGETDNMMIYAYEVTLPGATVIPEPATGAMVLGGCGMLMLLRRRRGWTS